MSKLRICDMDRNTAQQAAQAFQANYYAEKDRGDKLQVRVAELEAIIEKMDKTADGVPLAYGDKVYWWEDYQVQWAYFRFIGPDGFEVQHVSGARAWPHNDFCYSTQELAAKSAGDTDAPTAPGAAP